MVQTANRLHSTLYNLKIILGWF